LTFQAHHDALTLLPNRWFFLEQLEQAQRAARATSSLNAVLFLDVDRFKLINDSLGHEVGDRLLLAVTERLSASLRPGDIVARFGGDEFTVLLTELADSDTALVICDRIIDAMREPVLMDGHELFISSSVGVALSSGGSERATDLLRQADLAMYVAKEKGRGRWELFDPSFAPHVIERLELEGDLWRALEHGELLVHFQPEIEIKTGKVVATEALLRWRHPRKGMLEPDGFIPLAEESSLIVAIDRFVLAEACQWSRLWNSQNGGADPLVVSVNLSPRFMRQADVVADITSVLRESGVDPRCVQLEITERSAVTDIETTCAQLHQLRALGVRVAVDDFGTGYSSLSYLKQLPIDVLKLDKSFVDGLDEAESDVAIVQAIVTMGHALGVKVTAEGVERKEQAARLRELDCDSAMGWLWSKAVPAEELAALADAGFRLEGGVRAGVVVEMRKRA
jgi:diguanylate cyclase (GGDEF)-like protein